MFGEEKVQIDIGVRVFYWLQFAGVREMCYALDC